MSLEVWEPRARWRTPGRILNISRSGALVSAGAKLPKRESLWLRLDHPEQTPWLAARVVRIDRNGAFGIEFLDSASELYEAATHGIRFGNVLGSIQDSDD